MTEQRASVAPPPGRTTEVDRLADVLDALGENRGGVALVSGEGGVGKTTLSAWAAEEARERGMTLLDAPCFELSTETPYACLVSALGPVLRGERGGDPGSLVAGLHSLRLLFDGVDTGDGPMPGGDDRLATSRLHGALATLFSRLCADAPVVLAVDDLHWADSVSLEVIQALAADLPDTPLLVLATLRPYETSERPEARRLVRAFRTAGWTTSIEVGGLDLDATRLLVQQRLGSIFPNRLVDLVHQRSGGTPLVAQELLEVMIETGAIRAIGRSWALDPAADVPVPAVADDLIGDRLERLGPEAIDLVAAIAIGGRPVPEDLLASVVGRPTTRVSAELEELRKAGIVDRSAATHAAWVVHHPIIGEVAVGLLGPERRSEVHRGYVAGLPEGETDRRARHLIGADRHELTQAQVSELVGAARRALGRGAPDDACRLAGFALDVIDDHGGPDDDLLAVLMILGDAWSRRGEFAVACHHLERARTLAREVGTLADEVEVLALFKDAAWNGGRPDDEIESETTALLRRLEAERCWLDAHRLLRAHLMSRYRAGAVVAPEGFGELERYTRALVDEPDAAPEAVAEVRAWTDHLHVIERLVSLRNGPDLLAEIDATLRNTDSHDLRRRLLNERLDLMLLLGTREQILAAIADQRSFAEEHGDWLNWRIGLATWDVAMGDGDLDRTAEIEEIMRVVRVERPVGYLVVARAITDLLTGRRPTPIPDFPEGRPVRDPVLEQLLVFAEIWQPGDRSDAAHAAVEQWRSRPLMSGMPLTGPIAAALASLSLGDRAELFEVIDQLERFDSGTGRASAWAQVLRGEASSGADRADAYADAAERFERLGRPFDAAICRLTAAEAGGDVDRDRLADAGRLFRDAPAPWLSSRLDAVTDGPVDDAPSPNRRVDDLGLTTREREVAEVVAEGLSNRETANRLFISVRTVTSHLDHIYTKLGIRSRAELADLIAGSGPDGETDGDT